ncbi:SusC/RagA family TonB-linked outer membrane protein [Sphingobacterium gobiense]|uniref:TonB-dependent receptor plug domain-containing protein n=1 Tax=Sphingobacterium gobiense TaxID=1382456 RepID=A0A2S9JUV3_9SPHI|nr:SusC/RagA family TonB-linked outer membrane protein [Sphingobacterium gobiense]PRD57038.1 hypothetical protein C5749_07470 [Sphingobacterium gobiense]
MRILIVALMMLLFQLNSDAQTKNISISGQVLSEDKQPISYVNIRAVKTNQNTVTDERGHFLLQLPLSDTVLFSAVGFKRHKMWLDSDRKDILIVLDRLENVIDEVEVNTGYQKIAANRINGSVTVLDNEAINRQVSPNILERLNGITNGLTVQVGRMNNNPQNKTNITIRGYSTINGPLDPLIVLDNFVYEGDIENINPNDIESVTVLKDAEATSIYGARGGNGVIILTTKKGNAEGPLRVSVSINTAVSEKPNLYALPEMNNADYIAVEELLFEEGFFDRDLTRTTFPPISPIVYMLAKKKQGLLSDEEYASERKFYTQTDFRRQYTDLFYHNTTTSQYYVGLTGGAAKTNFAFGAGHNRMGDDYGQPTNKTNLRSHFDIQLSKKIKLSLSGLFTSEHAKSGQVASYEQLRRIGNRQSVPYLSLLDEGGEEMAFYKDYSPFLIDTIGKGLLMDWRYFPYSDAKFTDFNSRLSELLGNVALEAKIVDGLDVSVYYQMQDQNINSERLYGQDSYYARNIINRFSQIDESTGRVTYNVPGGDIVDRSIASIRSQSLRTQLNFSKSFKDHRILAMLGMEGREVKNVGESWTHYGYRKDPLSYLPVDFANIYNSLPLRGFDYIPGAPIIEPTTINRFISMYGNFNYTYLDRYSLSGNIRRDGSNIYGVSTNDRWKPLWSLGLGYDIAKETFFQGNAFDRLRLKATYGFSGNVDLSRSALPIAAFGNNPPDVGGLPSASIGTLNNPRLRWEQVRQINMGLDFAINRLGLNGSIEYYQKDGTDLYGPTDYDYTTWGGAQTIVTNVAAMEGNGIDLLLRYLWKKRDFSWTSTFIYNYNLSKTKKYYESSRRSALSRIIVQSGTRITPVEGFPLYSLAAYRWGGLDAQGNPQGYLEGELTTDYAALTNAVNELGEETESIRYVGPTTPTSFGSWQHEFRYKGFALSFNLLYKMGYYFRKSSINYSSLINFGFGHPDYALRWQNPGDDTHVPSFEYPLRMSGRDNFYAGSDVLVRNASNVRLQFVNFSYNLDALRDVSFFKDASIYMNVSNLGLIWVDNKEGLDPDYADVIAPRRSWSIGLRTSF